MSWPSAHGNFADSCQPLLLLDYIGPFSRNQVCALETGALRGYPDQRDGDADEPVCRVRLLVPVKASRHDPSIQADFESDGVRSKKWCGSTGVLSCFA